MVNSYVFEENIDLMVTHTDDPTKILHKIGTEEYYDDPIDLISGVYTEGHRQGQPRCRFEYEEVDRPIEEVEENDEFDGRAEDTDTQEA